MARFGQRDPIKVCKDTKGERPWRLISGRHRLVGARREGLNIITFNVTGVSKNEMREIEVSENLEHRARTLCPLETAAFVGEMVVAARQRIAQEEGGNYKQQALAIKARWNNAKGRPAAVDEVLSGDVDDTRSKLERVRVCTNCPAAS